MKQEYTFRVIDSEKPAKEYGTLVLKVGGKDHIWSFSLAGGIDAKTWQAIGLFPAIEGTDTDSPYLEMQLLRRAPLKWRTTPESKKGDPREIVELIKKSGLQVASDSYRLIPAYA